MEVKSVKERIFPKEQILLFMSYLGEQIISFLSIHISAPSFECNEELIPIFEGLYYPGKQPGSHKLKIRGSI